ncbi:hypothetical protein BDZ91DRAFT_792434 [Kalaharituber pfeilii]|nr:hypothetical protein BDZ91DRAFT_792434 [Kalaharituber pfeilii]
MSSSASETQAASSSSSKPSVLIIGGLGFIGRYLTKHIHDNDLASEIKIVDKQLPQLAWLAPEFEAACSMDRFQQADMSREQTCEKIFTRPDGTTWDIVFNCGGDTRYSQQDEIYKQRSLKLSMVVGKEAAKRNVKCFVELSTGAIYKSDATPSKEAAKVKPWLKIATYKLQAENELQKIPGLNLVIVRMANVYGEYCSKVVGTMLCMARVYKHLDREMKWLWNPELKTNTVHVTDVARALWHVTHWYMNGKANWDEEAMGPTPCSTSWMRVIQGMMSKHMANIFNIKTGFHGTIVSQFAKLNLGSAVDEENDELLQPWGDLLNDYGITRPGPITPYLEGDTVKDKDFCLDGSRFKEVTGFEYKVPVVTEKVLRDIIDSYRRMNWWPAMEDTTLKPAKETEATV